MIATDRCPRCGTRWHQAYSYRVRRLALGLVLALTLGALIGAGLTKLGALLLALAGVLLGAAVTAAYGWLRRSFT